MAKSFFSINMGVLWVKLTYFAFCCGMSMLFPYLTLQMRQLGMSYEDISYAFGIIPALTFFASPIAGFIGDRLGYRAILIVSITLTGISATCFDLTPRFSEQIRAPTAIVYELDPLNATYGLFSVQWATCDKQVTSLLCNHSLTNNLDQLPGLSDFLYCPGGDLDVIDFPWNSVSTIENSNGSFCQAESELNLEPPNPTGIFQRCLVKDYPGLRTCVKQSGSHVQTFWIYFAIRTLFQWFMNCAYSLLDSTSVTLAKRHDSDYSQVLIFNQLGSTLGPLLCAWIIQDPANDSQDEIYYSLAFYVADGFFLLGCLLSLKLDVTLERTGEKTSKSLGQLITKPSVLLFILVGINGLGWGIHDSYLNVYLQEELGSPTDFISYLAFVASLSGFLISFVAKPLIQWVGDVNMIAIGILVEGVRLIIYATVIQTPPYYAFALHALDCITWTCSFIATIYYAYTVAPLDLIGTMTASINTIEFIIAKGIASLIGGQLLARTSMEIPDLFLYSGIFLIASTTLALLAYHFWIKRFEVELVAHKAELIERMRQKQSDLEVRVSVVSSTFSSFPPAEDVLNPDLQSQKTSDSYEKALEQIGEAHRRFSFGPTRL